jgi:glutathione synthase/RimK-type ligase-like ATP-grasp enzyme
VILILSTARDEHAQQVFAELLKIGAEAQILDLSEFPQRLGLSLGYDKAQREFLLGCDEGGLDLDDCGAVWWRRPQSPDVSADITQPGHRLFAFNECSEALQGLWQSLDAFWINDPARDQVAHRKAYQLRVAQDAGLTIPATLISNCPRAAGAFVSRHGLGRVVYKSFSATEQDWRETRILKQDEVYLIDNVKYAPVIFQEYIDADVDLRITVVGDRLFPAAIYSQQTSYKVDFRMDIANARIEATELPPVVEEQLRTLMARLGLVYGAIDMRRTPAGEYVFLEINPAGQWLFVEYLSKQPIAATLAQTLADHDR